jgi:hypothetical protein
MFVAIFVFCYTNFSESNLFKYVLVAFIIILGLTFSITFALMMGEAFLKTKKYIGHIYSLEESK